MSDVSVAFAKFAGIQKAMQALLDETTRRGLRPIGNFAPSEVEPYFMGAVEQLQILRENLPDLFGDFSPIQSEPNVPMSEGAKEPIHFGRR